MSLVIFIAGFVLASLDIVIGAADILPDCAGFFLMLMGLIPLFASRRLRLLHLIWPLCALCCSTALLFTGNSVWTLFLTLIMAVSFFVMMYQLIRLMFSNRSKGSLDAILFQTMLTAQFFLILSKTFSGLLSAIEIVGILLLFLQTVIILYEIVIVCRRWPARPIQ